MDAAHTAQLLYACLDKGEHTLRIQDDICDFIVYDSHNAAFVFSPSGATWFHRLYTIASMNDISIHACCLRFVRRQGAFAVERRIHLCQHIPLSLRILLRLRYQLDGLYLEFSRS